MPATASLNVSSICFSWLSALYQSAHLQKVWSSPAHTLAPLTFGCIRVLLVRCPPMGWPICLRIRKTPFGWLLVLPVATSALVRLMKLLAIANGFPLLIASFRLAGATIPVNAPVTVLVPRNTVCPSTLKALATSLAASTVRAPCAMRPPSLTCAQEFKAFTTATASEFQSQCGSFVHWPSLPATPQAGPARLCQIWSI